MTMKIMWSDECYIALLPHRCVSLWFPLWSVTSPSWPVFPVITIVLTLIPVFTCDYPLWFPALEKAGRSYFLRSVVLMYDDIVRWKGQFVYTSWIWIWSLIYPPFPPQNFHPCIKLILSPIIILYYNFSAKAVCPSFRPLFMQDWFMWVNYSDH